jgi:hypothetical protein
MAWLIRGPKKHQLIHCYQIGGAAAAVSGQRNKRATSLRAMHLNGACTNDRAGAISHSNAEWGAAFLNQTFSDWVLLRHLKMSSVWLAGLAAKA